MAAAQASACFPVGADNISVHLGFGSDRQQPHSTGPVDYEEGGIRRTASGFAQSNSARLVTVGDKRGGTPIEFATHDTAVCVRIHSKVILGCGVLFLDEVRSKK